MPLVLSKVLSAASDVIFHSTLSSAVPEPLQAAVKVKLEVCSANATLPPPSAKNHAEHEEEFQIK